MKDKSKITMRSGIVMFLLFITQVKSQITDRLYQDLFTNYNPETLPMTSLDSPVVVKIGISLVQITSVDLETGDVELETWLSLEWNDGRLRWSSEEYNNISSLRVNTDNLWTPDIEAFAGYMTSTKSLAIVNKDGTVLHVPKTKFRLLCGVDQGDKVGCAIKLGSWSYNGLVVDVEKYSDNVDLGNFIQGRWLLGNVTLVKNTAFYTCCPEPYSDVTGTLLFTPRRKIN